MPRPVSKPAPLPTPPPLTVHIGQPKASRSIAVRDPRYGGASATEISRRAKDLENYLAGLPPTSPERARVHDRLAEAYVKLRKVGQTEMSARAIAHYDAILQESPNYSDLDAVLYYDALEHEIIGEDTKAALGYREAIERTPYSVYVPFAYFALGELANANGDVRAALDAYGSVLEYVDSRLAPNASERMTEIYERMGDRSHAEAMRRRLEHDFRRAPR
jgi:tetratricopeptide (TPR) repeat protein